MVDLLGNSPPIKDELLDEWTYLNEPIRREIIKTKGECFKLSKKDYNALLNVKVNKDGFIVSDTKDLDLFIKNNAILFDGYYYFHPAFYRTRNLFTQLEAEKYSIIPVFGNTVLLVQKTIYD